MKAIALVSGGLDSTLAARIIKDLGVELVAFNTISPFCQCNRKKKDGSCQHEATKVSQELGIKLVCVDTGMEILEIIKKPKHGYGSHMNPCIDCRVLLFKKAKELMVKEGASFIITGEVVGQRPMSQKVKTMRLIEQEAGLEGLVLRPLSANVLEETIPEKQGWVSREKLYAINGRGRRQQFDMAKELGINDYPCPAGGCLLTDAEFSVRLKDLMANEGLSVADARLLKVGRHFRFSPKTKLVVGRNESENLQLKALKQETDFFFFPDALAGPSAVLRGDSADNSFREISAKIVASYCDKAPPATSIICQKSPLEEFKFVISPLEKDKLAAFRIN